MTINQLKYVLEIYRCGSMREASNRLFISQPALSASIKELEEETGVILFERNNKGINVTKEGREFIMYAQKVISQFAVMENRYLEEDSSVRHFSVSTQHYNFANRAFAEVIRSLEDPRYSCAVHETKTFEVIEHVRDGVSEIGILSYSNESEKIMKKVIKDAGLEFVPLMVLDTYAYLWEDHELAQRTSVSIEELKQYPYVCFEQDSESSFYLTEEALSNLAFDKVIKVDERATSLELIALLHGFAIGCGMLTDEAAILKGLKAVKLEEEDPLTIGYLKRKNVFLSELGTAYERELLKYKI